MAEGGVSSLSPPSPLPLPSPSASGCVALVVGPLDEAVAPLGKLFGGGTDGAVALPGMSM